MDGILRGTADTIAGCFAHRYVQYHDVVREAQMMMKEYLLKFFPTSLVNIKSFSWQSKGSLDRLKCPFYPDNNISGCLPAEKKSSESEIDARHGVSVWRVGRAKFANASGDMFSHIRDCLLVLVFEIPPPLRFSLHGVFWIGKYSHSCSDWRVWRSMDEISHVELSLTYHTLYGTGSNRHKGLGPRSKEVCKHMADTGAIVWSLTSVTLFVLDRFKFDSEFKW